MMKIFIGTSPNGEDAVQEKILEYSLRKHATEDMEITWMRNSDSYLGEFKNQNWATPFTALRWTPPEVCNFEGRALYMDVDMLNLRDISELYNMDLKGKSVALRRGGRSCVMLFNCEKAKNWILPIEQQKIDSAAWTKNLRKAKQDCVYYDNKWNCLDGENYKIDEIYHLHFTKMSTQPWKPAWYKRPTHPHKRKDLLALWNQYKEEAGA